MDCNLIRTLNGAAPADDAAKELFRKWPIGEKRKCDVRKPRDYRSLKRYMALCKLVYENNDQFKSPAQVHDYLKIRAGHCTHIVSAKTGEIFTVADSIDYDTLDEDQFQEVWQRVVKVVAEEIIPGIDIPSMELEVLKCCGLAA
jgi:hypothetical protein